MGRTESWEGQDLGEDRCSRAAGLHLRLAAASLVYRNGTHMGKLTDNILWHSLPVAESLEKLQAQAGGLTEEEVRRRLKKFGRNKLPETKGQTALARFLGQFRNILIYVLLGAAALTAAMGHWLDSTVIAAVVVINAIIGFIQEGKAQKALESIRAMLSLEATVLRDGQKKRVRAEELVPGDIVTLQSGDKIPADLRLLEVKNLYVQEAVLTGESDAVDKSTHPVEHVAGVGDRISMAFSSTLVTQGRGKGVVVATGEHTELGRISEMVAGVEELQTPLLRKIEHFGKWLSAAIGAGSVSIFVFGWLVRDYTFSELFLAAVSIAVAAIPEGLPPIMTITLAIGVRRMAARNAIIRRLPAVETLGSVTVICSDKTGTLTRNEMAVQRIATAADSYEISGIGYAPEGRITAGEREISPREDPVLLELLRASLLCNDSRLEKTKRGEWKVLGDPTEGALLTLAMKAGLDRSQEEELAPRLDTVPFESEHKYMATLHETEGGRVLFVKGAPERILAMCCCQQGREGEQVPLDRPAWEDKFDEIAGHGFRLLGIAKRPAGDKARINHADVQSDLILLGFLGLMDPPREEAIRAVAVCHDAGIEVKMITGDHAITARSIAAKMGIGDGHGVVTGVELEDQAEAQLQETAEASCVFARTSPEHKLRLVKALQARNHIVAMTGDGVNDAPALKRADIGIAMGIKGSEASKEAAEMVLADDNFASIAHAVEEGRTIYDNLRKTILFLLPTNGGQSLIIVAAILAGMVLPIIPVQILWVNMVSVVTLAMALAFEPPEAEVMKRPPRDAREPLLTGYFIWRIAFVSVLLLVLSLGLFLFLHEVGYSLEFARTAAVNMLVAGEMFYLLNCRRLELPVLSFSGLFENKWIWVSIGALVVLQAVFTYLPIMQRLFQTEGLDAGTWLIILAGGAGVFVIIEIEKATFRYLRQRRGRRSESHP
jgi:magnesium-transporting ATPase (P-type)